MKTQLRRVAEPRKGPASGDIDDLDILTPAYFLIGAPLLAMLQLYDADSNLYPLAARQEDVQSFLGALEP